MSLAAKIRRAPVRAVTGAFILNSGIGKLGADEDTAKGVHGMASGAYPALGNVDPKAFVRSLGVAETALGTALLLPIVPAGVAGAGLVAFSGSLLTMWYRTPGMRQEGSLRPTPQGTALAKDSWMLGIGAGLVLDSVISDTGATRAVHKAERRLAKAEHRAAKLEHKAAKAKRRSGGRPGEMREELLQMGAQLAGEARTVAVERADDLRHLSKQQAKQARKVAEKRGKQARKAIEARVDDARGLLEDLDTKQLRKALSAHGEDARAFVKQNHKDVRKAAEKQAKQARKALKARSKQARKMLNDARDTASSAAGAAANAAKDTARDLGDRVSA